MLASYDIEESVDRNLDRYLDENGFTRAGYDEKTNKATVFGVDVPVPNTESRKRAIRIHDLHHLVTGFGTDPTGEGEISAWEIGAGGLRDLSIYVRAIVLSGASLGCVLAPLRMKRAFEAGRRSKKALFGDFHRYDALLAMSLGDLRRELAIPAAGISDQPRRLHARAPKASVVH